MRKLTEKEALKLQSQYWVRGRTNPIMIAVNELKVGEYLLIEKSDWKAKTAPTMLIPGNFRASRDSSSKKKFRVRTLLKEKSKEEGWLVKRII